MEKDFRIYSPVEELLIRILVRQQEREDALKVENETTSQNKEEGARNG